MTRLTAFFPDFDYSLSHTQRLLKQWHFPHDHQYLFYKKLIAKIAKKSKSFSFGQMIDKDFFELIYLFCAVYRDRFSPFTDSIFEDEIFKDESTLQSLTDFMDSFYLFASFPPKYKLLLQKLPTKNNLTRFSQNHLAHSSDDADYNNLINSIVSHYHTTLKNLYPSSSYNQFYDSLIRDNLICLLAIIKSSPELVEIAPTILCLYFIQYRSQLATTIIDTPSFANIFKPKKYNFSSATSKSYNTYFIYIDLFFNLVDSFKRYGAYSVFYAFNNYVFEEQTHLYSFASTMQHLENVETCLQADPFSFTDALEDTSSLDPINLEMLLSPFSCFYNEKSKYIVLEAYHLNLDDYCAYDFDSTYESDLNNYLLQYSKFQSDYIDSYFKKPEEVVPLITSIYEDFFAATHYEVTDKEDLKYCYLHIEDLIQQILEDDLLSKLLSLF